MGTLALSLVVSYFCVVVSKTCNEKNFNGGKSSFWLMISALVHHGKGMGAFMVARDGRSSNWRQTSRQNTVRTKDCRNLHTPTRLLNAA